MSNSSPKLMNQEQIQDKAKMVAANLVDDIWNKADKPGFDMNTASGARRDLDKMVALLAPQANKDLVVKNAFLEELKKQLNDQAQKQNLFADTLTPEEGKLHATALGNLLEQTDAIKQENKQAIIQGRSQGQGLGQDQSQGQGQGWKSARPSGAGRL